jgi:hypothetical protein
LPTIPGILLISIYIANHNSEGVDKKIMKSTKIKVG